MTLRKRLLTATAGILVLAVASFAIAISYDAPCPATEGAGEPTVEATAMQAALYRCYGSPEVVRIERVAKPVPGDDHVLVKVRAASVNPLDWHYMRGSPYIMRLGEGFGRPVDPQLGVDFAGTVEAVGKNVTRFKPGDEVFGGRSGAFAEYVLVREDRSIVHKPANLSFEQAAAIPIAAITALQALRDRGRLQPGQRVLINGASGGVGTYAVQIAKTLGAEVTGVCSTRNVELVRSLGADRVIDYTKENFTQDEARYDLILDNIGNHGLLDLKRVLKPEGSVVIVGGPKGDWIGPLGAPIRAFVMSPFVGERFSMFLSEMNPTDLGVLAELAQTGKIRPVIDRRYALHEIAAAIDYLETGRARGKVVINVPGNET